MRIIYVSTSISDASESIILFADGHTTLSSSVYPLMIDLSLIYRIDTSVVNGSQLVEERLEKECTPSLHCVPVSEERYRCLYSA